MKYFKLTTLIFGLLLFGCNHADNKTTSVTEEKGSTSADDKEHIQNLIRQVLKWADSKNSIDLLPVISDSKDSSCIGFDFKKHKLNLEKLMKTNLFAVEFIENYNQIILTLDKKTKRKEFDTWNTYELPTFIFANDISPWTMCQDVPYNNISPWNHVEVEITNLNNDRADAIWKWGKLELNKDPGWKDFAYKFQVVKEIGKWKIAYLKGFDFNESIRKDGEI